MSQLLNSNRNSLKLCSGEESSVDAVPSTVQFVSVWQSAKTICSLRYIAIRAVLKQYSSWLRTRQCVLVQSSNEMQCVPLDRGLCSLAAPVTRVSREKEEKERDSLLMRHSSCLPHSLSHRRVLAERPKPKSSRSLSHLLSAYLVSSVFPLSLSLLFALFRRAQWQLISTPLYQ